MLTRVLTCLLLITGCATMVYAECVQGLPHIVSHPNDMNKNRLVGSIYFCPDKTELDDADRAELRNLKEYEERMKTHQVIFTFVGFADVTKGKVNNEQLALRRALAVQKHVEGPVELSKSMNYHAIHAYGLGDRKSDPEFHTGWRRVDILAKVLEGEKRVGPEEAIERSLALLGSVPGESEDRLRCILNKLLDPKVSDLYFSRTKINDAPKSGIPPNRFADVCDSARERVRLAVEKAKVDAELLQLLRQMDTEIRHTRVDVGATATQGYAEDPVYTQVRLMICALAKSPTHIYSCYGECE